MPKRVDLCMFCGQAPCDCTPKVTKKPARKKVTPSVPAPAEKQPTVLSTSGGTPKPDPKAAMKAAAQTHAPLIDAPTSAPSEPVSTTDPEFEEALNNLEALLHPQEKRRYLDILNRPSNRARRWKARNGK